MPAGDDRMMKDTQWPRFEVFLQERQARPYQDAGSVHAVDAEMALLNARNVFARRPECVSMWVVPVDEIFARTRAQLESWDNPSGSSEGARQAYSVFTKQRSAGTHTFIGEVQAASAEQAMQKALEQHGGADAAFVWWVLPSDAGVRSQEGEIDSMYAPASEKSFRMASDFHTLTAMRSLRQEPQDKE